MIEVNITWMENTSSRNAYYQVFEFRPDHGYDIDVQPVTVTHYGSLKGVNTFHRPVESGKTTIFPGKKMAEKVGAKISRGYIVQSRTDIQVQKNDPWFTKIFGAAMAFTLNQEIFNGMSEVAKYKPSPEPDTEIIPGAKPIIEDRPESWGTW